MDLTPRFKVDATLFPGDFIEPGGSAACLGGRRVKAFLPAGGVVPRLVRDTGAALQVPHRFRGRVTVVDRAGRRAWLGRC